MALISEFHLLTRLAEDGQSNHLVAAKHNELEQSPLSAAIALKVDAQVPQMIASLKPADIPALLSSTDKGGWTALHHAAVRPDAPFYSQLKKLIGDKSYKKTLAFSPSFLRKICGCSRKAFPFRFQVFDLQGKLQTWSEAETLKEFPFTTKPKSFSYFSKGDPETVKAMWKEMAQRNLNHDPYTVNFDEDIAEYSAYVERVYRTGLTGEIALKTITHNDRGDPVAVGGGIVALQDISVGTIFMEYGGIYVYDQDGNGSNYAFELVENSLCVDALEHRSPGAMMNHGWPNAKVTRIVLPGRLALAVKALFPIKAGEEIRITYGPDCGNFFKDPIDLAPQATDLFLKKHPLSHLSYALIVDDPSLLDYQICCGWTFLLRDSGVYFLKKLLEGKVGLDQAQALPKILFKMGTKNMHPLESGRWRNLLNPFLEQVPLAVFWQALHILQYHPEQGSAKAQQLRGYKIPKDFVFT